MSNTEKAREHAAIAERLLATVDPEHVKRRQGFVTQEMNAAQVAAAHAALAAVLLQLPEVN